MTEELIVINIASGCAKVFIFFFKRNIFVCHVSQHEDEESLGCFSKGELWDSEMYTDSIFCSTWYEEWGEQCKGFIENNSSCEVSYLNVKSIIIVIIHARKRWSRVCVWLCMVSVFIRPNSKCEPGLRSPTIKETKLEDKQTKYYSIRTHTWYGSQLDEGLRSSKYPLRFSATSRGIRMEQPRLATPAEKSWMEEVSWRPVSRLSLSLPSWGS